jgi:hypothetical protein
MAQRRIVNRLQRFFQSLQFAAKTASIDRVTSSIPAIPSTLFRAPRLR